MRCLACNMRLTDVESTKKDERGDYFDLCALCYRASTSEPDVKYREDSLDDVRLNKDGTFIKSD